ncbi:hypothetical protein SAMN05660841_01787 [Sphingobacterium nematocida]|uniref:Uncharacterized protein n=2 Tax=Sphingobacterium nematocida TaxID=1513896 RepID=A0A1T5D7A3_9SPHI|nr:hypothetical protein SAMN05660841_01787 [Sphingobacterium nematocida]
MKNTQKKLKAKHFRYLSKENIEDPKGFLCFFFERIDLELWQEKIYVFLSSGSVQQRYPMYDPTFVHQNLVEQLEYAFVLYHKYELAIEANRFFEYLFERQSLENWLVQLDDVLRNQTDKYYYLDDDNYNPYLINLIELTHYLAKYLYLYTNNQEGYFDYPYYILPVHKLYNEELIPKNYHNRIGTTKESTTDIPLPFNPKQKVIPPEWLAPRNYSIEALKEFFDRNDLNGWRKDIRYWYESVLTENHFWSASNSSHFSGANLVHIYSCICSFLEMFLNQLSEQEGSNFNLEDDATVSIFPETTSINIEEKGEAVTLYYIKKETIENPLLAILESLSIFTLIEWQEILYDWLQYGLSSNSYIGAYATYTGRVYQTLTKVLELGYMIAFKDEIEFINSPVLEQQES